MKTKLLIAAIFLLPVVSSCGGKKVVEEQPEPKPNKLVLYYSQTGTTKQVADEIQKLTGADIDSIVAFDSYGYNYDYAVERWKREQADSIPVSIKDIRVNVNDYDTIYLGFPIWGGTYASPVATFLGDAQLKGKTIIPFATFGSGGIESATRDIAKAQPGATVKEGFGIRAERIDRLSEELTRFMIENGYLKGNVKKLPGYEDTDLTREEKKIFDEACGEYKFPLGTPISVAKRNYDDVTDYRFEVNSKTPEGENYKSTIYVTVSPKDSLPVFTRVVRQYEE